MKMTGATLTYNFSDLDLTVDRIESMLGYGNKKPDPHFTAIINNLMQTAAEVCSLKAEYRVFDEIRLNSDDKSVSISDISFSINKIVFGQLKNSGSAALFMCSSGEEIGKLSRQAMKKGDMLEGYILDVIGSEVVEAVADLVQSEIEMKAASEGMKITNRFSPGYCGWDVSEQHKIFHLLPGIWCGVRLSPSALMDPEKSVTGIIGLGKEVKFLPYTCKLCDMKDCIYRKHRK
jgi:hypothetical protein